MIKTIRRRFIRIALFALTIAMIFVSGVINLANWISVRQEMDSTMALLIQYDGQISNIEFPANDMDNRVDLPRIKHNREAIYENRYFSILYTAGGDYAVHDMTQIASYSETDAVALAQSVIKSGKATGFLDDFLYAVYRKDNAQIIIFLDCGTKLGALRSLLWISGIACLLGIAIAWLIVALVSKRMIHPLIESAEKQKQFITDAGHELKTPLTVISTNMELLTMDVGANEWIQSTQKQLGAMRSLVNELVFLSRMDEDEAALPKRQFNLTDALEDTVGPFADMAEFQGKTFAVTAEKGIVYSGDESSIRRLMSVLCDNALKHAPHNDTVSVRLRRDGKRVVLETENSLSEPMDEKTLSHLFDRFYRADQSRVKTDVHSGYGIGLAVAKAIVAKHNGQISACVKEGRITFSCVL